LRAAGDEKFTALIVDDEELARVVLRELIKTNARTGLRP
jgi:hypothetical protein